MIFSVSPSFLRYILGVLGALCGYVFDGRRRPVPDANQPSPHLPPPPPLARGMESSSSTSQYNHRAACSISGIYTTVSVDREIDGMEDSLE